MDEPDGIARHGFYGQHSYNAVRSRFRVVMKSEGGDKTFLHGQKNNSLLIDCTSWLS